MTLPTRPRKIRQPGDKRQDARHLAKGQVTLTFDSGREIPGTLHDISSHGIGVSINQPDARNLIDRVVAAKVNLLGERGEFVLYGAITRCVPRTAGQLIGIEVLSGEEETLQRLKDYRTEAGRER